MDYLSYTFEKLNKVFSVSEAKLTASVGMAVSSFFFGDLYTQALIAVTMLVAIDTLFGIAAAYANKEEIKSRRFGRVVVKGAVYFSAISAGFFADQTIPFDFVQAGMIGFVGMTEFISILENVGRLGFQTPKKLLNQVKDLRDNAGELQNNK